MKRVVLSLIFACASLTACSGASTSGGDDSVGQSADEVVLDVRCEADGDCPAAFECENEVEHGVDQSYCVSHDEDAAAAGDCPAGYELEEEHGGTFCKPHGGSGEDDDDDDHSGKGGGDDDHSGKGGDDAEGDHGDDDGASGETGEDGGDTEDGEDADEA